MKNLIFTSIIFLFATVAFSQSSIRIYTSLDEAKFKISFNDVIENTIPIKDITFDSLDLKKAHKIVLSFGVDSIADIESEYYVLKNQKREFEILKKKEILQKSAKIGRKIGKALKIGKHEKEGILYDVFYLEERTKSEFMNN